MRERGSGFSLIEVIVALGLLAGALVSVASLLVIAGGRLNSGRSSSEALAVARDIVEQLESWSFPHLYEEFAGCNPTSVNCLVDSRTEARAAGWQATLTASVGPGGRAEILLEGLDAAAGAAALEAARAIRLTVTVRWIEGARQRELRLATVRT